MQLEITFKDKYLTWYKKYKFTTLPRQERYLIEIKRDILRELQKLKLESQCITDIKENKKKVRENVSVYDQPFKILLDRLTFQIQYVQHREWFIV
jgi:hypothetical protein